MWRLPLLAKACSSFHNNPTENIYIYIYMIYHFDIYLVFWYNIIWIIICHRISYNRYLNLWLPSPPTNIRAHGWCRMRKCMCWTSWDWQAIYVTIISMIDHVITHRVYWHFPCFVHAFNNRFPFCCGFETSSRCDAYMREETLFVFI